MNELPSFLAPLGADITRGARAYRRKRQRRGRVAVLAASMVVLGGVGAAISSQRGGGGHVAVTPDDTTTVPMATAANTTAAPAKAGRKQVRVRHQLIESTMEIRLPCDSSATPTVSTIKLEIWADFAGERFRQRVSRDDGRVSELVVLGAFEYPVSTYTSDLSGLSVVRCDREQVLLGQSIAFMNPPRRTTNVADFRERAKLVPGAHVDSRGRNGDLYRESYAGTEPSDPILEASLEWFVDPVSGDVRETTEFHVESDGSRSRTVTTLVDDREVAVDDDFFATTGLQLDPSQNPGQSVTALPVPPTIRLGDGIVWPEMRETQDVRAIAERFTREVLRWVSAKVSVESDGGDSVGANVTITRDDGRLIRLLIGPTERGGRGIVQINGDAMNLGAGPGGLASVLPRNLPGVKRVVVHVRRDDGVLTAWSDSLAEGPHQTLLPGIEPLRVGAILATYLGPNDEVIDVGGWTRAKTDELHRNDPLVLIDKPNECAVGLAADFPLTLSTSHDVVLVGRSGDVAFTPRTKAIGLAGRSNDGGVVAYVEAGVVKAVNSGGTRTVSSLQSVSSLTVSPSGSMVGYTSGDRLFTATIAGGSPTEVVLPTRIFAPSNARWITDSVLAFVAADVDASATGSREFTASQNVWVVEPGGTPRQLTNFKSDGDRWTLAVTPVPAEGRIAFVVQSGRRQGSRDALTSHLWIMSIDDTAYELSSIPVGTYLAGVADGRLVWNVINQLGDSKVGVLMPLSSRSIVTYGCATGQLT
jgi:hypothetical protein